MNIVIVSNITRGLYSFRRELIEILAKEHHITIIAMDTGHSLDFKEMGCDLIDIHMDRHGTNPLVEYKLIVKYKALLRQIKPDVVLTYTIKPNIYAGMACASLGIRYIANITGLGTAIENSGKKQKMMLMLYKYGLRKAQKVFFQNQANMDYMIKEKVVVNKCELIPGSGVNLEQYTILDYPQEDTIDFTFIGRITKQKGIDQFIEAAKYIRLRYPDTRFHICGRCDSEYETQIQELNKAGTIIYHGLIDDVVGMHRISCCTVHPSYYPEGMSNVLLESCACARPVITTDRPGCREIVDDGVNGYIVKQKDTDDLIYKIEKFLSLSWEQRKAMGLAGRMKVEKEYDRRIVIDRYLVAINKIME